MLHIVVVGCCHLLWFVGGFAKRNKSKETETETKNHTQIASHMNQGSEAFMKADFRAAKSHFERMRSSCIVDGKNYGIACRLLSSAMDKLRFPEEQIQDLFKKALTIAHAFDDFLASYNTLTAMGSHAQGRGNLDVAEVFLFDLAPL